MTGPCSVSKFYFLLPRIKKSSILIDNLKKKIDTKLNIWQMSAISIGSSSTASDSCAKDMAQYLTVQK